MNTLTSEKKKSFRYAREIISANIKEADQNLELLYSIIGGDFKQRFSYIRKNRTKHMGGFIVKEGLLNFYRNDIANYFLQPERHNVVRHYGRDYIELRGRNYYIYNDKSATKEEKLSVIQSDLADALKLLMDDREQFTNEIDNILTLSVLEKIKSHLLYLFNILVFRENCELAENMEGNYLTVKAISKTLAIEFTEIFYNFILYKDFKFRDSKVIFKEEMQGLIRDINSIIIYIGESSQIPNDVFWQNDNMDPIAKLIYTNELVTNNPNIDTIIGIPRGATEIAFLLNYMYRIHKHGEKKVITQPVSLRSCKYVYGKEAQEGHIQQCFKQYEEEINNCNVLIVDDTILSGSTWEYLQRILTSFHPASTKFSAMEATLNLSSPTIVNVDIFKNKTIGYVPLKGKRFSISADIIESYYSRIENTVTNNKEFDLENALGNTVLLERELSN